jgi:GGDEF domain-containing protein
MTDTNDLLVKADEGLDKAKRAGKNMVVYE